MKPGDDENRRVLLFARDPGAANVVVPLIPVLENRGYEPLLFGKDAALKRYRLFGYEGTRLTPPSDSMEHLDGFLAFVKSVDPKWVVTGTGSDDFSEKLLWLACAKLSIPSFAILDHWCNYGVRFSPFRLLDLNQYLQDPSHPYLPEMILVMDEQVRDEMVADGFDKEKIFVSGQPYFDQIRSQAEKITRAEVERYRRTTGWREGEMWITFVSENITEVEKGQVLSKYVFGYTERSIFQELVDALSFIANQIRKQVWLVVKRHPNEVIDVYSDFEGMTSHWVRVKVVDEVHPLLLAKASDLVCGMASMLLIESAMIQVPVMSVQIGLTQEDTFYLTRRGLIQGVYSREDLMDHLRAFFQGKISKIADLGVVAGASVRAVDCMEGYVYGKTGNTRG